MAYPEIAIIVVSHNSQDHIVQLLESIPKAAGRLQYRTVIIDNASSDQTRSLLEARLDCQLLESENVGYAAAINRGIRASPGADIVIVLNPDMILFEDSLAILTSALLQQDGRTGIVVPRVLDTSRSLQFSLRREPTLLRAAGLNWTRLPIFSEYVNQPAEYLRVHEVDWALGAAMAIRTEVLKTVGDWDESFFLYSEETDFCLRARDIGFRTLYIPSAVVMHEGGGSGRSSTTHIMQIVNRVRLYRKRHRLPASVIYYLLTIISELTWWARGHSQSRDALAALFRPSRRPQQLNASDSLLPK